MQSNNDKKKDTKREKEKLKKKKTSDYRNNLLQRVTNIHASPLAIIAITLSG